MLGCIVLVIAGFAWRYRWSTLESYPGITLQKLPVPIMTYEEHNRIERGRPHVLEFARGTGRLLYVGVQHTQDPSDSQIDSLRTMWDTFQPTIALAESRLGFFVGWLEPGVRQFGEAGAVFALGREREVPVYTLEAPLEVEVPVLLERWPANRVAMFYILRSFLQRSAEGRTDREANQLLRKRTRWPGLEGSIADLAQFDSIYRHDFPAGVPWRELPREVTWPGRTDTYFNEISTRINHFRDEYMISLLVHLLDRGERVLAVVGSSHVVMQEPALRALTTPAGSP
jgi:hypothetical protein